MHVLPRYGGVLDQPYSDLIRLEKILDAFADRDELDNKRSTAKQKNRERHE